MPRTYSRQVALPPDLSFDDVERIWDFVTDMAVESVGELRVREVQLHTNQGEIKEPSFKEARDSLSRNERVESIDATLFKNLEEALIARLFWHPRLASSAVTVKSVDRTRALGVGAAIEEFLESGGYEIEQPKIEAPTAQQSPPVVNVVNIGSMTDVIRTPHAAATNMRGSTGIRSWFRDLSIEVVGGVIVAVLFVVVPILWWTLIR